MISEVDGDAVVLVHVQPRTGQNAIVGRHGDALRIRVQAPPVDGRATEAARELLAAALGVPPTRVQLLSGARSRLKRFHIVGCPPSTVAERLAVFP